MLVTLTNREILSLFPGFRIMAMSMERLEVGVTGGPSIPVNVINFELVIMLEVLSTIGTPPLLSFEQSGYSGFHRRVMPLAATPIHPVPIIRTPITSDFCMKPEL